MTCSILTLNKNRDAHLINLIKGLSLSPYKPDELIIIDMGDERFSSPKADFPIHIITLQKQGLPLAKARNLAAQAAKYNKLIFLDVDCIPSWNLIPTLESALDVYNALISPQVLYLPQGATQRSWCETKLKFLGRPHPVRDFPKKGFKKENNAGLFWSLTFAVSKKNFETIGGFCEEYTGYGGEDTDFSFQAQKCHIPHFLTADSCSFHQYHANFQPPFQHFKDIIKNARIFYKRWNFWPMEGWLQDFEKENLIRREKDKLIVLERGNDVIEGKYFPTSIH